MITFLGTVSLLGATRSIGFLPQHPEWPASLLLLTTTDADTSPLLTAATTNQRHPYDGLREPATLPLPDTPSSPRR